VTGVVGVGVAVGVVGAGRTGVVGVTDSVFGGWQAVTTRDIAIEAVTISQRVLFIIVFSSLSLIVIENETFIKTNLNNTKKQSGNT